MEYQQALRFLLRLGLLACFIVALVNALQQYLSSETNVSIIYEDQTTLPSLTACLDRYDSKFPSNKTLVDFTNSYEPLTENEIWGYYYTLDMSDHVDVGSEQSQIKRYPLNPIQHTTVWQSQLRKCITFETPVPMLETRIGLLRLIANMSDPEIDEIEVEIHERGHSRQNSAVTYDSIVKMVTNKDLEYFLKPKKTIQLDLPGVGQSCNITNNFSIKKCADDFIQSKLNCRLPWLTEENGPPNVCDTIKDKDEFLKVLIEFHPQELLDFGCNKMNCITLNWDMILTASSELGDPGSIEKESIMSMAIQKSVPTTVMKHSLAYGFSNLVADFGGYLGLLLGASLLSIYDSGIEICNRVAFKKKV